MFRGADEREGGGCGEVDDVEAEGGVLRVEARDERDGGFFEGRGTRGEEGLVQRWVLRFFSFGRRGGGVGGCFELGVEAEDGGRAL